jgi:hypothetical protein
VSVDQIETVLAATPVCPKLAPEDRRKVADVAACVVIAKGI